MRQLASWVSLIAVAVGFFSPGQGKADEPRTAGPRTKYFTSSKVLELDLVLGDKEVATLKKEPRTYVKANLKVGDAVDYPRVGVHIKGAASSLRPIEDKLS